MSAPRPSHLVLEPLTRSLSRGLPFHAARWGPLAGLAVMTYLLYPVARSFDTPALEVGEVAPVEVVAPFAFRVPKSPAEIAREAGALAATVRPVYEYRVGVLDSMTARIDALFAALDGASGDSAVGERARAFGVRLAPEETEFLTHRDRRVAFRRALLRMIREEVVRGVPASGAIEFELSREVVVRRDGRERVVQRDSVLSFARFLSERRRFHPYPNSSLGDQVFVKLIHGVFRPTLVPNVAETERLRSQMRASVDSVKDVVQANERIVAAHEVVTPEARDRLLALRAELLRRGERRAGNLRGLAGQILTNAAILSVFWLLLLLYRRPVYDDMRQLGLLAGIFALTIAGARLNLRFITDGGPELIPIPFAAMVLTVLISGRVAMVAAMVLAVLLGTQAAYGGQNALYIALLGGVAATLGVRTIRRRTQLLAAWGIVTAGFALAALTVGLRYGWSPAEMGLSAVRGAVNGLVSAALVTIALPIFEAVARVTTDLTLLELSDPNHPLLRRLATEAPGTYAHSIAMANLCEAACNAIGASGLLARVGCYYHDIGKLRRPQFFVENQGPGANPHDKLKPDVSAGIIRAHVKDGIALADEHRLPEAVKAFIPEHHGTLEIAYFLERARARGSAGDGGEAFRYPGPRPRSVETAVAMLGDGVEAALRVLEDPTPATLRGAIDHLLEQRIQAGQLADAPLTLAQMARVKEEFVRVLSGMHHNRIDYPVTAGGITAEWHAAPTP